MGKIKKYWWSRYQSRRSGSIADITGASATYTQHTHNIHRTYTEHTQNIHTTYTQHDTNTKASHNATKQQDNTQNTKHINAQQNNPKTTTSRESIPDICHFFTQAKFLENKIYTEKTRQLRQNTQ